MRVHNTRYPMRVSIPTSTVALWTSLVVWAVALGSGVAARQAVQPVATPGAAQAAAVLQTPDVFETHIRPLLAANCYACHAEAAMGGLRLDSSAAMLKGGDTGAVVEPGKPEASTLIKVLQHATGFPAMPKGRAKLPQADIDLLTEWVRAGAAWPAATTTAAAAAAPAAAREKVVTAEHRAFWSFRPLQRTGAPAVKATDWPRTDIDKFVLARLEAEGLAPVGDADKRTLLRRVTLDLTGLPPHARRGRRVSG